MVTGVKEAMVEDTEVKEVMVEAMAMVVGMLATVVAMEVNRQGAMEAATVATLRVALEVGILSSKGATVAVATVVAMEVNRQGAMEAATVATLRVALEVGILGS